MKTKLTIRSGIDLAAMVDIVFLLVTYFLINSTLAKNPAIKIQLPKSQSAEFEIQKDVIIYVNDKSKVYINDREVDVKDIPKIITSIIKDKDRQKVIIKGDKATSYQTIVTIMDYVNQAGISHINLATDK